MLVWQSETLSGLLLSEYHDRIHPCREKARRSDLQGFERRAANISAYPIDDLFKRDVANNIWHIAPVPPGMIDHPCPFPEEILDRLIKLYSYKNDTVLDPFLGSGQTAKVALALGRNCVGYDVEKSYVSLAEQRIREPSRIRKQQLVPRFAKVSVDPGELI